MENNKACTEARPITISEAVHEAMLQQDEINRIIGCIENKMSLTSNCLPEEPVEPMGLEGKVMFLLEKNSLIISLLNNINARL